MAQREKVKIGREARARLAALLSERVEMVLMTLTREHVGGTMTSEKALAFCAELACLEELASKIDREAAEETRSSKL